VLSTRELRGRRSTRRITTPPTMKASATGNGREEVGLDRAAERKTQDRGRDESHREVAPQRDVDREEPPAVLPDHRQHGAGLDRDVKDLGALAVEAEQVAGEDQVAGARDRQELGESLDDAEDQRVPERCVGHFRNSRIAGQNLCASSTVL
jgi:hypothetical protein